MPRSEAVGDSQQTLIDRRARLPGAQSGRIARTPDRVAPAPPGKGIVATGFSPHLGEAQRLRSETASDLEPPGVLEPLAT